MEQLKKTLNFSCAGNEEEWTSEICDDLIKNEEAPEIHKGMSWASILIAIVIVISGVGLVYLKKLRENRYKQLPTQNTPGGDTVTTTFNENGVWSAGADSQPVSFQDTVRYSFTFLKGRKSQSSLSRVQQQGRAKVFSRTSWPHRERSHGPRQGVKHSFKVKPKNNFSKKLFWLAKKAASDALMKSVL